MFRRLVLLGAMLNAAAGCGEDSDSTPISPPIEPVPARGTLATMVAPGQLAAVRVDWRQGQSEVVDPMVPLSELGEQAVARAPSWLRGPLRLRLGMVAPDVQDTLARLVLEAPDERIVDEIAFSIANVQEHDLTLAAFEPDLITENALALYEFAEAVPYAELVDSGAPGDADYGTTIRYQYVDAAGSTASYEIDRETYYWWVVHPKLDFDELVRVDPADGRPADAPTGVHWRRYVMESSAETFDYRDHYVLRHPNDLRGADLGLTASGHLTEPEIYPLRVLVDEEKNGLLVEIDRGRGTLLASTVNAAERYSDGETSLLVNLTSYGNTNVTLRSGAEVALVLEDTPWGADVYSAALGEQGITPTIVDGATLATLDLAPFDKIIVAAHQSRTLYKVVADRSADFEAYVHDAGVLQLDLHGTADLTGLAFPGGFEVAGGAPSTVAVEGQPRLWDYITSTPIVWDSLAYPGLSGDRPPVADGQALDIIGWFVSQNMYDNVAEYIEEHGVGNLERGQYPQRILHNHYGNCGELADVMVAAGRAALLPVRQDISVEDHVWNEVWVADRWIPWQVDWSDGPTRIDHPGVAQDEEYGGGKTLSGIWAIRGDGHPVPSTAGLYTSTITVELAVRDLAGRPVDGARALLWSESYYDAQELDAVGWAYTGADGAARLTVGHGRNYWFQVNSVAGTGVRYPVGQGAVEQIVNAYDSLPPDSVVTRDVTLDVLLDVPTVAHVAQAGPDASGHAYVGARALTSWRVGLGTVTEGHYIEETAQPTLQYYLLDQAAYDALLAQLPFDALAVAEDATELEVEAVPVMAGPLWLVAYNASVTETATVELDLLVQAR